MVTRRIRPSGNRTDVTFPQAFVVVCAIHGIELNVGANIISKRKMFYRVTKRCTSFVVLSLCLASWGEYHFSTLMRHFPWIPSPL